MVQLQLLIKFHQQVAEKAAHQVMDQEMLQELLEDQVEEEIIILEQQLAEQVIPLR